MDDSGDVWAYLASMDSCAHRNNLCSGPLQAYRSSEGEHIHIRIGEPAKRYYVGWTGTEAVVWNDTQALKSFLLPIDSEGDAVRWAVQHEYSNPNHYSNSQLAGNFWIRSVGDGYELVGERMTHMCHPQIILQVRFEISRSGEIRELARKTLVNDENLCLLN